MLDATCFVSSAVHEKEVNLGGRKCILYFKELPAIEFNRFQIARMSEDDEKRAAAILPLIVASLVEPDGTPGLTMEKAATLKPEPMDALFIAIMEVNGKGGQKKRLKPEVKSTSGTS